MGDVARGHGWRARAPLERRVKGTRVIAAVLGVFVGVSGLDHGLFEALQGSAPTPGLFIHAIGPDQRMWLYGTEDALTLIPNFLVAGIVSIVAGLLTIVWSIWFIDRPRGPTVLLALGALLFLVGGGIAMVVFVVFGWLVARRIGRPIDRWRGIVPTRVATTLASRWPWLVAVSVVLYAIALEIAIFGFVPGVTDPDLVLAVCWSALVAMLLVLVLALIGASAAETDTGPGPGRRGTAAGPRSDDGRTAASTSAGARSRGHGWRALALLSALAIGLGACTAGTEPSGSMRSAAPGSEPAARPSTSGAPPSLAAQACTTDTFRTATDELMAAIGNPDTDAPSEASQAFDDAIASGDPAAIEAAAAVVLQHLAVGHAAIAAGPTGADARIAAACTEWEEMLGDIEEGIALTRDGGVKGSDDDIEVGRALVVGALQDHFWQAVRGNDPTMLVEYLPDGRTASASRARLFTGAGQAFDGNPDTAWTTGDALPPQWVEIDLGWPATISGVRLVAFQDTGGATGHAVTVRDPSGTERELTRFTGETSDRDTLAYAAPSPVANVQVVRVTTEQTAGTIGWREIEVVLAPGSSPSPCAASDTPVGGLTATGGPPRPDSTPEMAIDGDPATAWDPGQSGSLSVGLARPALVSTVRVLTGEVPAGAPGWFVQVFTGTRWMRLEQVTPDETVDGWLTIPGPAPCMAVSGVQLMPSGFASNPPIREIQILGTTAP